jgi:hypothetical protein
MAVCCILARFDDMPVKKSGVAEFSDAKILLKVLRELPIENF